MFGKRKFVVSCVRSEGYFDSVVVEEANAYNAIVDAAKILKCLYADIVSVTMIPD